ncbi:MAG: CBS domain-containing protein [Phycisphaerales bacterium]
MLAKDIMVSPVVTVDAATPVPEVAGKMQALDIGSIVVTDTSGSAIGIITESDFTGMARCVPFTLKLAPVIFGHCAATDAELQQIFAKARKLTAREIMSGDLHAVAPTDPVAKVVHFMMDRNRKHVPVIEHGKPVGMIARHDILRLALPNPVRA